MFSLTGLSSLVWYLPARSEPNRVKHLSVASLQSRLPALPTKIRLGWKGLLRTNNSLFQKFVNYGCKSFITLGWGRCLNGFVTYDTFHKLSCSLNLWLPRLKEKGITIHSASSMTIRLGFIFYTLIFNFKKSMAWTQCYITVYNPILWLFVIS